MQDKLTIEVDLPKHPVGTKFVYRYGKQKFDAEVVGYHVEYNTDTKRIECQYRAQYNLGNLQIMKVTVARSTVDRSVMGAK